MSPSLPPRVIALEGLSGSGKTTVAAEVARRTGAFLVPEAFARIDPAPSLALGSLRQLESLELQLLAEDVRRLQEARRRRERGGPVIMDTGVLGTLTYTWGLRNVFGSHWDVVGSVRESVTRAIEEGEWGLPDLTLYLDVDRKVAVRRAEVSPISHPSEFIERHSRIGARERTMWLSRFPRILPQRFERIDARPAVEQVVGAVISRLGALAPNTPATELDARRLLARIHGSRPRPGREARRPGNR